MFTSALCHLIKNYKYCNSDAEKEAAPVIGAIKEMLRGQLTSIASKLLSSEHTKLEDLSVEEQHLWNSFYSSDIYEFITREPDTLPEFQFNWIEPCQLSAHLPPGTVLVQATHPAPPPAPAQPPIQTQPPAPAQPLAPAPPPALAQPPAPAVPTPPTAPPLPGPSGAQQLLHSHDLRPRKPQDYKELNSCIKQRWRKLRRQAKVVVTKLAPGGFFAQATSGQSVSRSANPRAFVLTCAILWSCFLQLSSSNSSASKKPILIDSIFTQPDKLQLRFRPMGHYAASTFTSHVRIPFDYSALLQLQDKMIERMDRCIPDLDRFNFNLDQYNRATLNSTFELYKSDIRQVFKLFKDLLASLPHVPECQQRQWDIATFVAATSALTLSTYNTVQISKLETAI
jgi:hypothetical protein